MTKKTPEIAVPVTTLPFTYQTTPRTKGQNEPEPSAEWNTITAIEALGIVRRFHDWSGGPSGLLAGKVLGCGEVFVRCVQNTPETVDPWDVVPLETLKDLVEIQGISVDRRSRPKMIAALKRAGVAIPDPNAEPATTSSDTDTEADDDDQPADTEPAPEEG